MTREEAIYEIKQLVVLSTNKNIERITEALNMAIEALQDEIWKDEPCNECVFVKGSGWCDNCNGKPKGLDTLPNSRKAEQTEPNSSEKPNNCETQTEVETMSCAECKHRPIGAEICEEACHYEPQTDWHYDEQDATWYPYKHEDEPQTDEEYINNLPWTEVGNGEQTDEPQTERSDEK